MTTQASAKRDDSIQVGRCVDDAADWQFNGAPGWRRTTKDGRQWVDDGPIDEFAQQSILAHFGLDAPATAALYPVERLAMMPPEMLRALSPEQPQRMSA